MTMEKAVRALFVAILVLSAGFVAPAPVWAARAKTTNESIAVVVNDQPITVSDVFERLKLIIVSSGMPNSPEMQKRLQGQVINMLIDENLKMQEARKLKITVSPQEIEDGFSTIARRNKLTPDQFKAMLVHDGIDAGTLRRQIQSQIAWGKVVQRKIRPRIEVTEADIAARQKLLEADIGKTQYAIAEIFLPVDSPEQNAAKQALADRLYNEIAKHHAPFQQVAAQFSQEAAAARGGDLGWVQSGAVAPEIATVLANMKEGDVSAPVKTTAGYYILLLHGKRAVTAENMPSHQQLYEQIGTERLERQQRHFLMDLRAGAYIDRRV